MHHKLTICLLFVFTTVLVSVVLWFALTRGMLFALGGILLIPAVIFFTSKPHILYMSVIMTFFSGIRVPYLFADFRLFDLLALFLVSIGFMDMFARKGRAKMPAAPTVFLISFLINLVLVIAVRGTGFRFLGDTNWGGMRYVQLIIGCLLYFNSRFVSLSERQWKIAIGGMFLLGLLPFMAEALFIFSGGRVTFHYVFFEFASSTIHNLMDTLGDRGGVARLQTARLAGESIVLFALAFMYMKKQRPYFVAFLWLVGLVLVAISGHRLGLLRILGISWLFFAIEYRRSLGFYVWGSLVAAMLAVAALYLTAPMLPLPTQRMVSFLPGISIDQVAYIDAYSTTRWRLNLWHLALAEIPDYLFIGKGYTFSGTALNALRMSGTAEFVEFWALETSAYHNGVLSLLIGMGIPGLVIGTCLVLVFIHRYGRLLFSTWTDTRHRMIYQTIFCLLTVNVAYFYTLYGDVQSTFPQILFLATVLEGMLWCKTAKSRNGASVSPEDNGTNPEHYGNGTGTISEKRLFPIRRRL